MALISGATALAGAIGGALATGAGAIGGGLAAGAGAIGAGLAPILGAPSVPGVVGAMGPMMPGVGAGVAPTLTAPAIVRGIGEIVGAEKAAELARRGMRREEAMLQERMKFESEEARRAREAAEREAERARGFAGEEARLGREFTGREAQLAREERLGFEERQRKEEEARRLRAGEVGRAGEEAFLRETTGMTPELAAYQKALREGTTEDIQRATGEIRAGLTQRGVRGVQAGQILARSIGQMRREKERDIAGMAYEEALKRRERKARLAEEKALIGARGGL